MADDKAEDIDPSARSGDFKAMAGEWRKVETIFAGVEAIRKVEAYLPKFPDETDEQYAFRTGMTKFTNIYSDIVENLSARPFAEEVKLHEDTESDADFADLAENIDAQGHSIHEFAASSFYNAVGYAVDWIVVDYSSNLPDGASVAAEKAAGVRAFWRRYTAPNCVAVYSAMIDGEEHFVHARFLETHTQRDQFKEAITQRVRVWDREKIDEGLYGPPTVALWEKQKDDKGKEKWVEIEPPRQITIDIIPIVPMICGRRKGASWQFHVPMKDAADLQIEHYQQESGLKYARTMACFPVLTGNGVSPDLDEAGKAKSLTVGPNTILYAPPSPGGGQTPNWQWIEPTAETLKFMQSDIKETAKELRELGRQPLTSAMGNLTVITSAVAGQKGQAAVQSWAMSMKKAIERALQITALWLKKPDAEPHIAVNMDFDLTWTEDNGFDHVLAMRESGDLSRAALITEAKRRNYLDKEYDEEADLELILAELESSSDEDDDDEGEGVEDPPESEDPDE